MVGPPEPMADTWNQPPALPLLCSLWMGQVGLVCFFFLGVLRRGLNNRLANAPIIRLSL